MGRKRSADTMGGRRERKRRSGGRTITIDYCGNWTNNLRKDVKKELEAAIPGVDVRYNFLEKHFQVREGERRYYSVVGEWVPDLFLTSFEVNAIVNRVAAFQYLPDEDDH